MCSKGDGSAAPYQTTKEVRIMQKLPMLDIPLREVKSRFRRIDEVTASIEFQIAGKRMGRALPAKGIDDHKDDLVEWRAGCEIVLIAMVLSSAGKKRLIGKKTRGKNPDSAWEENISNDKQDDTHISKHDSQVSSNSRNSSYSCTRVIYMAPIFVFIPYATAPNLARLL